MKRSLASIIISMLFAHCSSAPAQTVVNVASDIIPKSQVVWCNNEINKLQVFVDAVEDDIYLPSKYTEEQAFDLYNSYQYFSTTSNLFYGAANSTTILIFKGELNSNVENISENAQNGAANIAALERGADFCTTWYQAQNS
tara:strand:+ start:466 stop:888 length:423 start_codon:yes stop_codon:yes gene_type:complete